MSLLLQSGLWTTLVTELDGFFLSIDGNSRSNQQKVLPCIFSFVLTWQGCSSLRSVWRRCTSSGFHDFWRFYSNIGWCSVVVYGWVLLNYLVLMCRHINVPHIFHFMSCNEDSQLYHLRSTEVLSALYQFYVILKSVLLRQGLLLFFSSRGPTLVRTCLCRLIRCLVRFTRQQLSHGSSYLRQWTVCRAHY